jgi:hypothetical protein
LKLSDNNGSDSTNVTYEPEANESLLILLAFVVLLLVFFDTRRRSQGRLCRKSGQGWTFRSLRRTSESDGAAVQLGLNRARGFWGIDS